MTMLSTYGLYALGALILFQVCQAVMRTLVSPLRKVPGPLLARFSRLWYFHRVWAGSFEHDNIALHKKYGPIVRVGPDLYSIDSPSVVKSVYGISSKFAKSDWYDAWRHPDPQRATLFTQRDIKKHGEQRRKFQALYSMSSMVHYEPFVDDCLGLFRQRMDEVVADGQPVNMAHWVQCYAFDVIACVTYSKRFGFLDEGKDVQQMMSMLEDVLRYGALVGIYGWLHPMVFWLTKNVKASGAGARLVFMSYLQKWQNEKAQSLDTSLPHEKEEEHAGPQDFTEKLLIAHQKDGSKVTVNDVFLGSQQNIFAGSDTTGATISGILYHLLRNPDKMQKLKKEIEDFASQGKLSQPITFKESQEMPYLQSVMKEGMRLHPAVGLPLWRVVPEGGVTICDQFFPAGTTVGLNAWVAHHNDTVFAEPDAFRPERWLDASPEQLKEMDSYYLPVSCSYARILVYLLSLTLGSLVLAPARASVVTSRRWR
jgi:cytochrome P450